MNGAFDAFSLTDRVAVITGAGSGIGRGAAILFAQAGARCVLADINTAGLDETARLIGADAMVRTVDVADRAQVDRLAGDAVVELGGIDVWANVAGITAPCPMLDLTEEVVDRMLSINLKGVIWGALAAAKAMQPRRRGSIINISSTGAINAPPTQSIYSIAKAGVNALTRNLAAEMGPFGIRVNTVSPGYIETPLASSSFTRADGTIDPEARERVLQRMRSAAPLAITGEPEDIGYAMLYLASDASRLMTGQNLYVNGGVTLA